MAGAGFFVISKIISVVIWQGSLALNPSVLIDFFLGHDFCQMDRFHRNGYKPCIF